MKFRFLVIGIFVVFTVVMLNGGLISRASTKEEAIEWGNNNLSDSEYFASYTAEEIMYDKFGNERIVQVPSGATVIIHWTGDLYQKNDEFGNRWCFQMEKIAHGQVIANDDKCVELSKNSLTGKFVSQEND